jgi:hypothetical protein
MQHCYTGTENSIRKDMGGVIYAANVLGSRGPRKMQVSLPGLDEEGRIRAWRSGMPDSTHDDMLQRMKDKNMRDLVYLINKPPRWNEQVCRRYLWISTHMLSLVLNIFLFWLILLFIFELILFMTINM